MRRKEKMESNKAEIMEKFAKYIRAKKIGIKNVAAMTKLSRNRVRQLMHGATDISSNELGKFQTLFGMDMLVYNASHEKDRLRDENTEPFRFPNIDEKDINHPERYGGDTEYECIKVLKAWLSKDEYRGFLKGNAIKYLCRLGKKDEAVKEIQKAEWYLRELEKSYGGEE